VVLDCSRVRQLDSAGIQVLLRCLEEAMKRNGDVKLAAVSPAAAAILELTRVAPLFETFDSTADAVHSFSQPPRPFQRIPEREYSTSSCEVGRSGYAGGSSVSRETPSFSDAPMRTSGRWLMRQIAGCLVLLLVARLAGAAPSPQQETNSTQQVGMVSSAIQVQTQDSSNNAKGIRIEPSPLEVLPDSPGTVRLQAGDDSRLSGTQQSFSRQPQNSAQEPSGTAAAPLIKTTGVAASRPAGAAIAPARQKRARSILIKVSAIVGAGAAVGTVVALSMSSPGRPH
jgi:hypothetical protein